jgi:Ca2+-binding RTX toxin-like protein
MSVHAYAKARVKHGSRRFEVESLEPRLLMAVCTSCGSELLTPSWSITEPDVERGVTEVAINNASSMQRVVMSPLHVTGTDSHDIIDISHTDLGIAVRTNGSTRVYTGWFTRIELHGQAGNDHITYTGDLPLWAFGGAGNDTITGGTAADILHGEEGNDVIDGGGGADTIYGEQGRDTIRGGTGNDEIYGGDELLGTYFGAPPGAGYLAMLGLGGDTIDGGSGLDNIHGGNEWINLILWAGGSMWSTPVYTGVPGDLIHGGDDGDTINGEGGDDTIYGDHGTDVIYGGQGNDMVDCGSGSLHIVNGGEGDDTVLGGPGTDRVWGGLGNDELHGNTGNDELYGNDGDDTIFGDVGTDVIRGGNGNDELHGGYQNDTIWGGLGDDRVYGDDGIDTLYGDEGSGDSYLDGDDTIMGGGQQDFIFGQQGNDSIRGDGGPDQISGGPGDDDIWGGDEPDTIDAGNGNDQVWGEDGADLIEGGSGNDSIYGGFGNDTLHGGHGVDVIDGESGDDTITGGWHADYLYGGRGNDTLHGESDTAHHSGFEDFLWGGEGNDRLIGGKGNDHLMGGPGMDALFSLEGSDIEVVPDDVSSSLESDRLYTRSASQARAWDNVADAAFHVRDTRMGWWTIEELLIVDDGFRRIHEANGTDTLIQRSNGQYVPLVREEAAWWDGEAAGWNDGTSIYICDLAFEEGAGDVVAVHEMGHFWDEESPVWEEFIDVQSWTRVAHAGRNWHLSGDRLWWWRDPDEFYRGYGRQNPLEDWCTSWEAYFFDHAAMAVDMPHKFAIIDEFIRTFDG